MPTTYVVLTDVSWGNRMVVDAGESPQAIDAARAEGMLIEDGTSVLVVPARSWNHFSAEQPPVPDLRYERIPLELQSETEPNPDQMTVEEIAAAAIADDPEAGGEPLTPEARAAVERLLEVPNAG